MFKVLFRKWEALIGLNQITPGFWKLPPLITPGFWKDHPFYPRILEISFTYLTPSPLHTANLGYYCYSSSISDNGYA